jgi:hypothetical protein
MNRDLIAIEVLSHVRPPCTFEDKPAILLCCVYSAVLIDATRMHP